LRGGWEKNAKWVGFSVLILRLTNKLKERGPRGIRYPLYKTTEVGRGKKIDWGGGERKRPPRDESTKQITTG